MMASLITACSFHCNVVIRKQCQDPAASYPSLPHFPPWPHSPPPSLPLTPDTSSHLSYTRRGSTSHSAETCCRGGWLSPWTGWFWRNASAALPLWRFGCCHRADVEAAWVWGATCRRRDSNPQYELSCQFITPGWRWWSLTLQSCITFGSMEVLMFRLRWNCFRSVWMMEFVLRCFLLFSPHWYKRVKQGQW